MKKKDRKIIDVKEIGTNNEEYFIPGGMYGTEEGLNSCDSLSGHKIEFDKDGIVTIDIPANKEKTEYHRGIIKCVNEKKDIHGKNSVTINKIFYFPQMANGILEGLSLEDYLNFNDAVRLIRIELYKGLLNQPEEIIIESGDKNLSKPIKTKDVLKKLEKEDPFLIRGKEERR